MAGPDGRDPCADAPARQREVANTVHRFVPNEFIRPAQRAFEQSDIRQHDRVGCGCAADEAFGTQHFLLMQKAERSGAGQLFPESLGRDHVGPLLAPDHRVGKVDRDVESEGSRRERLVDRRAVDDAHGIPKLQILGRLLPSRQSGGAQRLEERCRAPIQNWWFRSIDVDPEVIEVGGTDRSEHVLHRVELCPGLRSSQLRPPLREHCAVHLGRDGGMAREIRAPEHDARAIRCGSEGQAGGYAEVEAESLERHGSRDRLAPSARPTGSSGHHASPSRIVDGSAAGLASRDGFSEPLSRPTMRSSARMWRASRWMAACVRIASPWGRAG